MFARAGCPLVGRRASRRCGREAVRRRRLHLRQEALCRFLCASTRNAFAVSILARRPFVLSCIIHTAETRRSRGSFQSLRNDLGLKRQRLFENFVLAVLDSDLLREHTITRDELTLRRKATAGLRSISPELDHIA